MEQRQRPKICHPPVSSWSNQSDASALWDLEFSVKDGSLLLFSIFGIDLLIKMQK